MSVKWAKWQIDVTMDLCGPDFLSNGHAASAAI